ncbi:hypothetical protein ASE00_13635 [Sphingomonas sp. Root710]|uniref:SDR family NAD(P)-dependent oxidoreductase n=1 Tax=Sphingomonas sp. Root710 TaxID=1736594 RepID=UPI0006F9E554|nr:SDR family NAD(P)-dependent oxidoreductase [Sphingomonas sp. Root710]KRB83024.1 hypothetical protein ASE00_13635 [Sphingomonas sp. Root710]
MRHYDLFSGGVALVTGGGSGIGAALAAGLAKRGCAVAVTDIEESAARTVAAELRRSGAVAQGYRLDVANADEWNNVATCVTRELGPTSILCSNAGVSGSFSPVIDLEPDRLRWLLEVNLIGALLGVQRMVPEMIARGHGSVLFTGSMAGLSSAALVADYSMSKHGLIALADCLRQETADKGVRVTVLCPAAVRTALGRNSCRLAAQARHIETDDSAAETLRASLTASSGGTITPMQAAERGLDALSRQEFLALTHPQATDRIRARTRLIDMAIGAAS